MTTCEVCFRERCLCKKKRVVDKKILAELRGASCIVCNTRNGTVAHHVKSVGSGGPDLLHNLMVLCQEHHMEIHKIETTAFAEKYIGAEAFLLGNGWEIENEKWWHSSN